MFRKERGIAGLEYVPAFPPLLLKTVSESDVFLYTTLLPRIPFKPSAAFFNKSPFTKSEEEYVFIEVVFVLI